MDPHHNGKAIVLVLVFLLVQPVDVQKKTILIAKCPAAAIGLHTEMAWVDLGRL
jgi:hypothetical protein